MIIKSITINNFRSYYGENTFTFSNGLTLIIGGNGDGKTTFFEALEWLLNTTIENKDQSLFSEKRKSEMFVGDSDAMYVSMRFEHNGEKEVVKKITFEKQNEINCICKTFSFLGYDTIGSQRIQRGGKQMIDACFDSYLQRYCLFKGESQLNVFKDETALQTLVDKFSDIRKFENYVEVAKELESKSEKAYTKECSSDKKIAQRVSEYNSKKEMLQREIKELTDEIKKQEEVRDTFQLKLEDLEKHQETSEKYHDIKERLKNQKDKLASLRAMILRNYNALLLDDYWILAPYLVVFKEFEQKVAAISKSKRQMHQEDVRKKAEAKAKNELVDSITATLENGAAKLPFNIPDAATMQEMLDDHICKVCGHPAPEGSKEYAFMKAKLEELQAKIATNLKKEKVIESEKELFVNKYIEELHSMYISYGGETAMDISQKLTDITDTLEFVADRKADIKKKENEIQELEDELSRLLIQADGLSEDMLDKSFLDIKGYFERKERATNRIAEYSERLKGKEQELNEVKEELNSIEPTGGMAKVYGRVHLLLEQVMKAFENAKNENFRRFLDSLEVKTNHYFAKLNEEDFYGTIRINQKANNSADVKLYSSNGTHIKHPGGAQETTMYMSLLFAVSDLTTLKKEEDYPLIFDAPTSSFEDFKEEVFYNIIDSINKQCIIVTKDLLEVDKSTGAKILNINKINDLTCSVYRIEKEAGYDEQDLSTVRTLISKIK